MSDRIVSIPRERSRGQKLVKNKNLMLRQKKEPVVKIYKAIPASRNDYWVIYPRYGFRGNEAWTKPGKNKRFRQLPYPFSEMSLWLHRIANVPNVPVKIPPGLMQRGIGVSLFWITAHVHRCLLAGVRMLLCGFIVFYFPLKLMNWKYFFIKTQI